MPSNLCRWVAAPLRLLPARVNSAGLALILDQRLAGALADGELDFLRGRVVGLIITDQRLSYRLRLDASGFTAVPDGVASEVCIQGDLHSFLLLATRCEDADSLFFQRRLSLRGDTALGLHLKNFLDARDEPPLPLPLQHMLERFGEWYGRYCAAVPQTAPLQVRPAPPVQ